ncbi:GIY-YIG nuclease family protein [Alteraurantiacibacter aquimixticola]|uniref:GIY-YIG nuclease family protein n=1 Tax=Alteraurantiacibacter aquimixticola TaxID=2489173 RepID=A0A4V4U8U2_9SPHN|nr:GIY-YIG nuclease family protein [Alteraurantiacibacter aquimixticola]TIX51357.1 GIY-YIG nuclease family protein [Alteraurantiacibacter aquimixticola]
MIASLLSDAAPVSSAKGAYVLLLYLEGETSGRFGRRDFTLPAGRYAYCGSANGPGGIAARVGRHMRHDKSAHWHVDQLTVAASDITALAFPGGSECALVERLLAAGAHLPLPGFGSSDCRRCEAHLLHLR